ncbi:hypothetical protein ACFPT7_01545 [Acidicapsa dinghuensis]|uniref:Uncharacterized protein n=1 Tax=Acidicapsa dinghuensis TaxID=2218256 RepID=A0ABW1E9Q7_9BACT|nr:hypothetical protein [Acidicapsa dinghuensis]
MGIVRFLVLTVLLLGAFNALLQIAHVSGEVQIAILVLFWILSLFGKYLVGTVECIQIVSPGFERRIQHRYRSQLNQLRDLEFSPLFSHGEAFPLYRLLLIYPAFLFTIMVLNREVASIEDGSKLVFGYSILNSSDRTTYAHALQFGVKYHTLFQDDTILLTKNFGARKKYDSGVVLHMLKNGSISATWAEHQKQVQLLEATGKQINREINFQNYLKISRLA